MAQQLTFRQRAHRALRSKSPAELAVLGPQLLHRRWRHVRLDLRRRRTVLRNLRHKEFSWSAPWSMRRIDWWRFGFLSRSAIIYELDVNGPENYISDLQRYAKTKTMVHPQLQAVINNKLTTHLLFSVLDIPAPELLGVYSRRVVHPLGRGEPVGLARFLRDLPIDERIFIKPLAGAEGKRVYSIRRLEDDLFRVNGVPMGAGQVSRDIRRELRPMVVERGVEQHPDQRALFAETTNTIRILTMPDDDLRPFVVVAVQRIGTNRSGHVDNWTQGGLSARIDLETGTLGPATWLPRDHEAHLSWFDEHPETGAPIAGQRVPHWDRTLQLIDRIARDLTMLEYVGWDVIISEDGPVVLEANINSGMNVLQVHQPLLEDERARRYFQRRGVITERHGRRVV